MTLVLDAITVQLREHVAEVRCELSADVTFRVNVVAPESVLRAIRPVPRSFLYMAYLIAARRQEPLVVACAISSFEWLNFCCNYVPLVSAFYSLPKVPVSLAGTSTEDGGQRDTRGAVALMFSAGIDSFHSLLELQKQASGPDFLVSINAGAFAYKSVWQAALENVVAVSRALRIPLILIDTNFHHVLRQPHLSVHTIRNLTAAALLGPAISTAIYSSSTTLEDLLFGRAKEIQDMSSIEPVALYAMQQRDFGVVLFGHDVERIDKTRAIHAVPMVQRYLNVCTDWRYQIAPGRKHINCSQCPKCARTQLTLEALGSLAQFGECFDLGLFYRTRDELIEKLKLSRYRIDRSVVTLLEGVPQ